MLKLVFFLLLLANGVLFAFHQGYLDALSPTGHEPERVKNQLNADKIRLIAAPPAALPAAPPADEAAQLAQNDANDEPAPKAACVEIGLFTAAEARRFEAQFAAVSLGGAPKRVEISEPSSHMVLIPPQNDRVGANNKVAELRALGVTDYFILQDPPNPELRWAISLGVFKSEEAARAYIAQLSQRGVRSARMVEYKVPMKKFAFQMRTDARTHPGIEKLKSSFPGQQLRDCPATTG